MGSVRNPVGPLPSSIYWRRRAVLLCLLALVVALVLWGLNSGGGGGGTGRSAPTGSRSPVATITAGPEPSGTHISDRPGGRETSPGGAAGGSSSGTGGATPPGSVPSGTPSAAGGTSAGADGGSDGSSASGGQLPVGSTLPDCGPGSVQLALSSVKNAYSPDDRPAFQLHATNSGGTTCKLDVGPRSAVFTITATADGHHVWASDDCPATGSFLLQVPARSSTTFTLHWNGTTSSPQCATPGGRPAGPGTYLVQAKLPGFAARQVSFVLTAD